MSGHADHFCSYPCMARAAVSDTEVVEHHDFDGTCITCGQPVDTPRETEVTSPS